MFINNRERTGLVEALAQQVSNAATVLTGHHAELPVRGVLCFLGTELPWVEERVARIPLTDLAEQGFASSCFRPGTSTVRLAVR